MTGAKTGVNGPGIPGEMWSRPASECRPDQIESEVLARAVHTRELTEPLLVESAFAARMLSDAGAPAVVPDLGSAIGVLEEFLGEQGYQGVIHAARRWAAPASRYTWTNQGGPFFSTPLAHRWAFGGGYADVLENTLVATGPVHVWRNVPFEQVVTTGKPRRAGVQQHRLRAVGTGRGGRLRMPSGRHLVRAPHLPAAPTVPARRW
ncbi:hypothetical protein ABZV91_02030 [Nocardia sp. NPDC004568]|uniref:hypothetical protein n=1 Tax=Nocardia sp. NPDC004568 TaxID=3154551 RepID=UPI0033B6AC2D